MKSAVAQLRQERPGAHEVARVEAIRELLVDGRQNPPSIGRFALASQERGQIQRASELVAEATDRVSDLNRPLERLACLIVEGGRTLRGRPQAEKLRQERPLHPSLEDEIDDVGSVSHLPDRDHRAGEGRMVRLVSDLNRSLPQVFERGPQHPW